MPPHCSERDREHNAVEQECLREKAKGRQDAIVLIRASFECDDGKNEPRKQHEKVDSDHTDHAKSSR